MKKTYKLKLKGWTEELIDFISIELTDTLRQNSKLKKYSQDYLKMNFSTEDKTKSYYEKL